jgi:hypothetical protein
MVAGRRQVGSGRHPDRKLEGIGGKLVGSREEANI